MLSWRDATPAVYRACELCTHGVDADGARMCTCRDVVQPAKQQPVEVVRRLHGPCGPDAHHLDFPGLRPR